ncbi:MAG: PKD domain-containing protein [Candidatus Aminicenantes bacterium]|nr:PKD domain-containing protein [Candidatus Aminicenantes bacterium]NIM81856.1 PKD domain-containing protein [Candidatus Aminicenantes bacterium]NIN21233.1 PKD domain-containing protein [Candidatus Aminicenantes bacterium]NIN45054.1 PKD domain-containing protein [Candidatus Aminicenantes bacterium]NIN87871.1 PKD domain-containing protein [Candidatus Aminicenantes bacterium]
MNKKKWRFNGKVFSTITLVFVVCCFMATSSWAAKKVEFYQAKAKDYIKLLNQNKDREGSTIGKTLGLSRDEEFKLLRKRTDFNGVTHYRYQQTYKGIPVWGMQTNVGISPGNNVVRLHGTMVLDIPGDIKNIPSSLDPRGALRRMEELHKGKDKGAQWTFRNEKYGTYIYIDEKQKAHLCSVVSFFADTEKGNPSQFIHFIDVKKGKVLRSFDMLRYQGVGPGGNLKVGYYYYGIDYPPFCVTEAGGTCFMDCTYVRTCNWEGTCPHSFTCYENTYKEVNGAYCPMNDAQYFGHAIYDMYNDWYGVPVLPFQLTLICHYSTNYEGYFWDGSGLYIGDGDNTFYPLAALDLIAHEVSHGFTEYHSDLIYSGQSGGINESFSDMAGEAAKYYVRGTNDFRFGYDIVKDPDGALRYLYDPPLDGHSIDHVDDYYPGMDVHYSSGIFNKAFYLIATSPGWTTRMAFDIFVKANMDYWTPSTTFQQGAEGAISAALDYGYSCKVAAEAFAQVGINVVCCEPPIADFSCSPTMGAVPLTVSFTDKSVGGAGSLLWDFGDGGTSTLQNPTHTYISIGSYSPALTVTNACGSDTMVKADYIKVYCASSGLSQDYEYIAGAAVADLNNPSGPSPYSNFTNLTAHLTQGQTVNVSLTPGFPGGSFTEYWKIWIDYNGNCAFEDEEEVFRGWGNSIVTGSFTVRGDTVIGDTLMRVSMKYGSYPSPCETFPYGEVEDYTANIACFGPGTITNPGFETGTTSGWTETGAVSITSDSHTGLYAVSVDGANSSVEQVIVNLCPSTTYTVSCWGKARKNANVFLGVKDYGGAEQTVQFTDYKNFVKKSITVTTGPTNTSATIFFIKLTAKFSGIADDFEIVKN